MADRSSCALVVDVQDGGGGGLIARAYSPDRSLVMVSLHPPGDGDRKQGYQQLLPMTPEQLAVVAASPGLSVTG